MCQSILGSECVPFGVSVNALECTSVCLRVCLSVQMMSTGACMKVWIYLKVKTCMDEFVNVSECVLVSGSDSMNVPSVWECVNVCVCFQHALV